MLTSDQLEKNKIPVIVLAGPTAVGKTELSLQIAEEFNAEIIGVDSMQIYKYMDIGTAKPSHAERGRVPHHLIDFIDPADDYNVSRFIQDAEEVIKGIRQRGKNVLMTGGTGLYFKSFFEGMFDMPEIDKEIRQSLLERIENEGNKQLYKELAEYDPDTAARIHENDTYRLLRALEIYLGTGQTWTEFLLQQKESKAAEKEIKYDPIKICLNLDRDQLYARINKRVDVMVEQGLLDEVKKLLGMGYGSNLKSMQSLGYRHIVQFLQEKWSWQDCLLYLARDTRRYAKRQLTWFRKDDEMVWVSPGETESIMSRIENHFKPHIQ